jgi:hypothetical protein
MGKGEPQGEDRPFIFRCRTHRCHTPTGGRRSLLGRTFPATVRKGGCRFHLAPPYEGGNPRTIPGSCSIALPVSHNDPLNSVPAQEFFFLTHSASLRHISPSHLFLRVAEYRVGLLHTNPSLPFAVVVPTWRHHSKVLQDRGLTHFMWVKWWDECAHGRTPCVYFRHGKRLRVEVRRKGE